jgi:phage tail-like protein
MARATDRPDPLPVFCFKVTLGRGLDSYFKSVSGLKSELELLQVKEGGVNNTTFNLIGSVKWSPIVLKNGFTAGSELLAWREEWMAGSYKRIDGKITLLDTALTAKAEWSFFRGIPSKWEIGEFDASKSELAIETLEIAHEGITYKKLA